MDEPGRQLVVGTHCQDNARVQVQETDAEVVLSLEVKGTNQDDCGDFVVVVLEEPLGDRRLVDKATGDRVIPEPAGDGPFR